MEAPVFINFSKKMQILASEKGSQIGPKMTPKKVRKKDTSKNEIITFFQMNLMKMLYFPIENGPREPILLYFPMNLRVRKGRKIEANVAKTLENLTGQEREAPFEVRVST